MTTALPRFADVSLIPNDRLTDWFFALQHARSVMAAAVERDESEGINAEYTRQQLAVLDELHMNIGMSRDAYLESLGLNPDSLGILQQLTVEAV